MVFERVCFMVLFTLQVPRWSCTLVSKGGTCDILRMHAMPCHSCPTAIAATAVHVPQCTSLPAMPDSDAMRPFTHQNSVLVGAFTKVEGITSARVYMLKE